MAREEYGVVLRDGAVDAAATAALRAKMPRADAGFGFNAARRDFERTWTRPAYARLSALLLTLPVEWRFFVKHRVFEEFAPGPDGKGAPEAVERVFRDVVGRYPQLRAAETAGAGA
jgi:N-methylhydantoinase B